MHRSLLRCVCALALAACALVPAYCWTTPVCVNTTSGNSIEPTVDVDENGKIHVAWRETVSVDEAWYATNASGSWVTTPVTSGSPRLNAGMNLCADGIDIHLVWFHNPDGSSANTYYRKDPGDAGSKIKVNNNIINCRYPAVACAYGYGPYVVMEHDEGNGDANIYFSEWNGAGFTNCINISPSTPNGGKYGSTRPNVTVSPNGDITVVWSDSMSGGYRVNANRRVNGVWQGRVELSTLGAGYFTPGIAAASDNTVHVTYYASGAGAIYYQKWNGSSWTAPVTMPGGDSQISRPDIAVDSNGACHIVAENNSGGSTGEVYYWTNTSGSWSGPTNLSHTSGVATKNCAIAFNAGLLVVAYQDGTNGSNDIWYTTQTISNLPAGTISGWVRDTSGSPMPGALVTTSPSGYSAYAGDNGNYIITDVTPDTYSVTATRSDSSSQTIDNVVVTDDQTATVNFTLTLQTTTCMAAKLLSEGDLVNLAGKSVTAVFSSDKAIYVEEPDRSAAIRVDTTVATGLPVSVGDVVRVSGSVVTRLTNGQPAERQIRASSVLKSGLTNTLAPLGLIGRGVGGGDLGPQAPGVLGGVGLNNIGLLAKITGRLTYLGVFIYVDDGSGIEDTPGQKGVYVMCPSVPPVALEDIVSVTGIIEGSVPYGWTESRHYIHVRSITDVVKLN